jgi:hypothetical protein
MSDQSYDLGRYFCDNPHHALLHYVLEGAVHSGGMALEFGVGEGHSLRCIARYMPVVGYDSFQGLPEDWRPGFDKGAFRSDRPACLPSNADIVEGLFEDTLPVFDPGKLGLPITLIHCDADLYSSTKTVLERCEKLIRPGLVILFDEFWGYPGCEDHEQRAWREFADRTGVTWEVVGHGVQQWSVRIV